MGVLNALPELSRTVSQGAMGHEPRLGQTLHRTALLLLFGEEVLSKPLRFARSGPPGNVTRSEGGALVTSCTTGIYQSAGEGSAVSEIVMRAGRRKSESHSLPNLKVCS